MKIKKFKLFLCSLIGLTAILGASTLVQATTNGTYSSTAEEWKDHSKSTSPFYNPYHIKDYVIDIGSFNGYNLVVSRSYALYAVKDGTAKHFSLGANAYYAKVQTQGDKLYVGPVYSANSTGTYVNGVREINLAEGTSKVYCSLEDSGLKNLTLRSTYVDHQGNSWLATGSYYSGPFQVYKVTASGVVKEMFREENTKYYSDIAIMGDAGGNIYLYRELDGSSYGKRSAEVIKLSPEGNVAALTLAEPVLDAKITGDGSVWVLQSNKLTNYDSTWQIKGSYNLASGKSLALSSGNIPYVLDGNEVKKPNNTTLTTIYKAPEIDEYWDKLAIQDDNNMIIASANYSCLIEKGVEEVCISDGYVGDHSYVYTDEQGNSCFFGSRVLVRMNADNSFSRKYFKDFPDSAYSTKFMYNGELYFADYTNIYKIDKANNLVTYKTLTGDAAMSVDYISIDSKGFLYGVDYYGEKMVKITPEGAVMPSSFRYIRSELGSYNSADYVKDVIIDRYNNAFLKVKRNDSEELFLYDCTTPSNITRVDVSSYGIGVISNLFLNENNEVEVVIIQDDGSKKAYTLNSDKTLAEDSRAYSNPLILTAVKMSKSTNGTVYLLDATKSCVFKMEATDSLFTKCYESSWRKWNNISPLPNGNMMLSVGSNLASAINDSEAPYVVNVTPYDSGKGSVRSRIEVEFNELVFPSYFLDRKEFATLTYDDPQSGATVDVPFKYDFQGKKLIIIPKSPLTQNLSYKLTILKYCVSDWVRNDIPADISYDLTFSELNAAPTDIKLSSNNASESLPLDSVIGKLSAEDLDSDEIFSYSLVSGLGSEDNQYFSISGNLLKTKTTFNYSVKKSYNLRVKVSDSRSASYEKNLIINIIPTNSAPTDIAISNNKVPENASLNYIVGILAAADRDSSDTYTYSLTQGDGSQDNQYFTISGSSLKTNTSFDFNTKNLYSVRVRTTDSANQSCEKVLYIEILKSKPLEIPFTLAANTIQENKYSDTFIGSLKLTDTNLSGTYTYKLLDTADNANFKVVGSNLYSAVTLNFEKQKSYNLSVRCINPKGYYCDKVFTVDVLNVNEAPTFLNLSNTVTFDKAPAGFLIGYLSALDEDADEVFSYSLVTGYGSDDNSAFTISGNALSINKAVNIESKSSYRIRIKVTDSANQSFTRTFVIQVNHRSYDINKDGTVDVRDFNLLTDSYNAKTEASGYDTIYDFNNDSIIDIFDLVAIASRIE